MSGAYCTECDGRVLRDPDAMTWRHHNTVGTDGHRVPGVALYDDHGLTMVLTFPPTTGASASAMGVTRP